MRNISIHTKLLGIVAVFALGFAAYIAVVHNSTKARVEESDFMGVIAMKDLTADVLPPPLYAIETYLVGLQLGREQQPERVRQLRERYRQLREEHASRERYWTDNLERTAVREALLGEASSTAKAVFAVMDDQLLPALQAGNVERQATALEALREAYELHRVAIDKVVAIAGGRAQEHVGEAATVIAARKLRLTWLGALLVAFGGALAWWVARDVAARSRAAAQTLAKVAEGDLSQRLEVDSQDELGQMASRLNAALDAINEVFAEVERVCGDLSSAAGELSSSSDQIASGAQQQAASLEETAASLEEITATVKQSAGNAQQASQLALGSRDVAERGGTVVSDAVRAMNDITQASRRIGDIITTIDEIALQTNLLALNAAVEAARAGDQGRGFAVVAAEVGNLAQRSATAAKEVKALIQDSLQRVESGHELVGESGRVLGDIIVSVKKVTDIVGEIAAASREQSLGVEQVNTAISQMDQVTQSNASQTEELSKTSVTLADHASHLQELVGRFTLRGGGVLPRGEGMAARGRRSRGQGRILDKREGRAFAAAPANANDEQPAEFEVV